MKIIINSVETSFNFSHETMDNGQQLTKCTILQPIHKDAEAPLGFIGIGYSTCSLKDNFCKETGRQISLYRAINDANFNREMKTLVINEYKTWDKIRNLKHLNHV